MDVERVWGCGGLDKVFGGDIATVPWPRAPRGALGRDGLAALVSRLIGTPPALVDVDPRTLWANQPSVVRHHAAYYLTGQWERTGAPSADLEAPLNRYPVVVSDPRGRKLIVAGHHRSLAALIEGRPVRCRVVDPTPPGSGVDACALTLTVTPLLSVALNGSTDVDGAVRGLEDATRTSTPIAVASTDLAAQVLRALGLTVEQIDDRLTMAGTGRTTTGS